MKVRVEQRSREVTRRLGVFSYSKSITETLLWGQKGRRGPAPIDTLDPQKQRFEEKSDVTLGERIREVISISMRLLLS